MRRNMVILGATAAILLMAAQAQAGVTVRFSIGYSDTGRVYYPQRVPVRPYSYWGSRTWRPVQSRRYRPRRPTVISRYYVSGPHRRIRPHATSQYVAGVQRYGRWRYEPVYNTRGIRRYRRIYVHP